MSENFLLKFRSKLYQLSQKWKALNKGREENRFVNRAVFIAKILEIFWKTAGKSYENIQFKTISFPQIYALDL